MLTFSHDLQCLHNERLYGVLTSLTAVVQPHGIYNFDTEMERGSDSLDLQSSSYLKLLDSTTSSDTAKIVTSPVLKQGVQHLVKARNACV